MKKKGVSLPEARRQNRVQIKELIYKKAPITRTEVAQRLGLTLPTISTSVQVMLADGILMERELPEAEHNPKGGRKPLYLDANPQAGYAAGVELGPYHTTVCLTDLRGRPLKEARFDRAPRDYEEMVRTVAGQILGVLGEASFPRERFLGVGVGLPGFIESEKGIIRSSMRSGWNGKPLARDMQEALGYPVLLENNVRARAVGAEMLSSVSRPDTFAYYFISKGIACSLMIQNDVFSGKTAGAGEVGHMIIQPNGPVCETCLKRGCLEALAGESAIVRQCQAILENGGDNPLHKLWEQGEELTMQHILALQREGSPQVCAVVENAVYHLGLALANIINFISPRLVLVEGQLMQNEANREQLLKVTYRNLFALNETEVRIEFIPFDRFSGARGSAAVVIKKKFIQQG